MPYLFPCALIVLPLLLSPAAAPAADWPRWGGNDACNMASGEKGIPASFIPGKKSPQGTGIEMPSTQNVKWVARLGTQTYGNVTVAGGKVYVGTNDESLRDPRCRVTRGGLVLCLDEAGGKLVWQLIVPRYETHLREFNFDDLGLGVCSSPTVEGDHVWLVTSRCEVMCLDANGLANGNQGVQDEGQYIAGPGRTPVKLQPTDADILWRYDMIKELKVWPQDAANCSVLVHGDFVYVCTSNGVDRSHVRVPSPLAPSLIVLDKRTGQLVAADDEKIGTRMLHGQWSSPSLGVVQGKPLIFYGGGDGVVYAFKPLSAMPRERPAVLKKVWWFDCNPPDYKVVCGKKVNYLNGDIRKHSGNVNDGRFVGPSEVIATPVFHKDRVYVTTGQDPLHGRGVGMLSCIDATKTGDVTQSGCVWRYNRIGRSLSTVAIADGLLYVADTFEGLHCLDADTGQCQWFHPTHAETWGSPYVVDGKVFLGTKKSLLIFATGKEEKLLGEISLGSPIYSTPVAANGVLYVSSLRYLWAVEERSGAIASRGVSSYQEPAGR